MEFIRADVLNQNFYTEGAFYQIELEGEKYICRGLARVRRKDTESDIADALVVMVNPGSCQPANKEYTIPPYNDNLMEIPMVAANSDQTQHQLMRLMEFRDWNMIYIINLSDLRTGNLSEFRDLLDIFRSKGNNDHSIFSPNRKKQITELLSEETKIIAGWGVQKKKKEKIKEALTILKEQREIFGIPHQTHPYYLHPKPALIEKRIEWLEEMNRMLG